MKSSIKSIIEVQGVRIKREGTYVSLTDIARRNSEQLPKVLITSWLKNQNTLLFLEEWERVHNSSFDAVRMAEFMRYAADNRNAITTTSYVEMTKATGLYARSGRGGGTFAHPDIALSFCYWLSPSFQVWMLKKFQQLIVDEFDRANLEYHVRRITDSIDEARNWLDSIPGQNPKLDRRSEE